MGLFKIGLTELMAVHRYGDGFGPADRLSACESSFCGHAAILDHGDLQVVEVVGDSPQLAFPRWGGEAATGTTWHYVGVWSSRFTMVTCEDDADPPVIYEF